MFGIGMSEMVIILAVALLVFGPTKLPEIAKQLAKGLKEIRKAGDDLRASVNFDLDDDRPARPRPMPQRTATAQAEQHKPLTDDQGHPLETPAAIPGSALADGLPRDAPWPRPAEGAVAQSGPEAAEAAPASTAPATPASPGSSEAAEKVG